MCDKKQQFNNKFQKDIIRMHHIRPIYKFVHADLNKFIYGSLFNIRYTIFL